MFPLINPETETAARRISLWRRGQKFSLTAILELASWVGECLCW